MPTFALKLNEFAKGDVKIFNLLVDGNDQFELFESSLEDKYLKELRGFASTIYQLSHKMNIPHGKRRVLKGIDGGREMKSRNLRLYYLHLKEAGILICLGAEKKTQKKDINRLGNIRKDILQQIAKHGKLEIK